MRQKIIDKIFNLMESDERIFFLTADMGINLVEKFEEKFPKRYLNVGIAEQNLIGICSGLCKMGYLPFAYTISNFIVHRCFEQIRNDISLHAYPITLMGTSAGFDNAPLGPTHHIIDDWGMLKSLPGFQIYCPSSSDYALSLIPKIIQEKKPSYIRIPKGSYENLKTDDDFYYKKGDYKKTILLSYSAPSQETLKVHQKTNVSFILFNKLHPLDEDLLISVLKNYKKIIVVEDHLKGNGLYSSICEMFFNYKSDQKIYSLSPKNFNLKVGINPQYFHKEHKLDANSILEQIEKII